MKTTQDKKMTTRKMVIIAMFGALSAVLMILEVPLVMLAPGFMKIDFSDLPALLGTFMMGPIVGVLIEVIKIALKLVLKPTSTMLVGELANFVAAMFYILPAALVYNFKKGKKGAILALTTGTLSVSILMIFMNMYVNFPFYMFLYNMDMNAIFGMFAEVNPKLDTTIELMFLSIFPFNLLKYGAVSLVTFFTYKKLKKVLIK